MDNQTSMNVYIDQSKICMFGQPIPKQTYVVYYNLQNGKITEKYEKTMKHFIGDSKGKLITCCNSDAKDANNVIDKNTFGSSIIKKVYAANGDLTEYEICSCDVNDNECVKNCSGFSLPTNYDFCKMTTTDSNAIYNDPKNKYVKHLKSQYFAPDCNTLKKC